MINKEQTRTVAWPGGGQLTCRPTPLVDFWGGGMNCVELYDF